MNYAITEDEYNAIQSVRGQLNLVCGLLGAKGSNSALFESSDLYDFLSAQSDTITKILKNADERYAAARDENNTLNAVEWSNIIAVVSGHRAMRGVDLKRLGRKLQNSVKVDPDMAHVFSTWQDVMTSDGERQFDLEPSSTDGFYIQFPERSAVVEEPTANLNTVDLVHALRIAAGDGQHTPKGAEESVTKAFSDAAQIDDQMSHVLATWLAILSPNGPMPEPTAPAKKPAQRKRDKLTAKTVEVV